MLTLHFPSSACTPSRLSLLKCWLIIATFRSDYEHEIEYEYDFRISKSLRSQRPRSSLLLTSGEEC